MVLGNTLKLRREERGESLRDVGAAVGMDPTQLSKVERGIGGCGDEFKLKLAQHFGIPIAELFFQPVVDNMDTREAIGSSGGRR